ncbi:hypothetical protein [Phenylobacterium sp.]|uniref:hypothetical protein n=1 Tax=Phenylobacterium sp. TaxID=1871053 RepID=UPI00281179A0|nr:hypothetical protein [Phenylobacterium sp.]
MPMVAAAVGAAVSWVGGAVASAGALLTSSLSVAGLSTFTASAITGAVGSLALNAGLAVLSTALMQPQVGAGGSPVAFKADPAAPVSGVMGRFGVGGRQLHGNVWGKGNLYLSFATALSLGPIDSIVQFRANDTVVTFPGPQGLAAPVEPYKDKMWMTYRMGLPSDAALSPPSGVSDGSPSMSEWTASHRAPMLAHSFWTLKNNSKRASYEGGVPRPLWTLLGMKVWDPRLDSTYPGGSGSQRRDDWTTWAYSENPYLHALAWARGHHKLNTDGSIDRTKRIAGIGAPDEAILIDTLVHGANVADANGWVIAGEWTTSDDKWQVYAAMLQAGGGVPLGQGAKIGCMVEAPRASILTLTSEDIVGPVRIAVMASRRDRPNTIVPRYRSEPHKWEEVPAGSVSSATYVAEDGDEERTREVSYRYVRQAKQAAELAAYDLANARETLRPTIPAKPYLLGLRAGDAFEVEAPETGMNGQKLVLVRRTFDPATATVTLECRSETDAKHAWALGQSANPPDSPSLTAVDPTPPMPEATEWAAVAGTVAGDDGSEVPAVVLTGGMPDGVADQVVIEYRAFGATDWIEEVAATPELAKRVIAGVTSGDWEVAVSYRRGNRTSNRLVLDPVAVGGYVVPLDEEALDTALLSADVMRTAPDSGGATAGALAVLDAADTPQIVDHAVTNQASAETSAVQALTGTTAKQIQTVTYVSTGEPIEVRANFFMTVWHPGAGGISANIVITRDGAGEIFNQLIDAIGGDNIQGWQTPIVIDTPPAGSVTYRVTVTLTNNDASAQTVQGAFLGVREYKR